MATINLPGGGTIEEAGGVRPPPADTRVSHLAFKRRWPREKWRAMIAFRDSTQTDPQALVSQILLKDAFDSFGMAQWIDLADADTIAIVGLFADVSTPTEMRLTAGEAAAILTDPIQEDEKP